MRDKEKELNGILSQYNLAVQSVYKNILSSEKNTKNMRKRQMKSLIDQEIMQRVTKDDN